MIESTLFFNVYHGILFVALLAVGFYGGWRIRGRAVLEAYNFGKAQLKETKDFSYSLGLTQGEGNSNAVWTNGYNAGWLHAIENDYLSDEEWYAAYDVGYDEAMDDMTFARDGGG
jgi:hypothetical protein